MHAAQHLIGLIETLESQIADTQSDVDVEALTVACQDLVTWASQFDPALHGDAATIPSDQDRALVAQAVGAIRRARPLVVHAKAGLSEKMGVAQHSRRALKGYSFLKPASQERQFLDFKA